MYLSQRSSTYFIIILTVFTVCNQTILIYTKKEYFSDFLRQRYWKIVKSLPSLDNSPLRNINTPIY